MENPNETQTKSETRPDDENTGGVEKESADIPKQVVEKKKRAKVRKKKAGLAIRKEKKLEKPEFIYEVNDKAFGTFRVRYSANAWWLDRTKLDLVINAYKYDATNEEVSVAGGITRTSLNYFIEKHPEFLTVIEACREIPVLRARQTVVGQIATDGNLAFKYLERKRSNEFGQKTPLVAVQINMAERVASKRAQYQVKEK